MKSLLVYPVFFYVIFQFFLVLHLFMGRLKAVQSKQIDGRFFIDYKNGELPKNLQLVSRAFDNQFQVPILFFITVLFLITLKIDHSPVAIICSWVFVISRLFHFYFHAIKGTVVGRYRTYALGWLMVVILWVNILINNLQMT